MTRDIVDLVRERREAKTDEEFNAINAEIRELVGDRIVSVLDFPAGNGADRYVIVIKGVALKDLA